MLACMDNNRYCTVYILVYVLYRCIIISIIHDMQCIYASALS